MNVEYIAGGVRFDIVLVSVRAVFYVSYWYHTVVLPIMFVRHNFALDFLREEFVAELLIGFMRHHSGGHGVQGSVGNVDGSLSTCALYRAQIIIEGPGAVLS